jgi:transketolase
MAGICNGMALHGGLRVFDATFLVFSDFMRGALRLSALMGLPIVHVFTRATQRSHGSAAHATGSPHAA